ncbi:MAG TPA: hypothetical protein VL354_17955 [Spirochaetia bacterium]|nr:hypothetical protein [Spirochaetia bacterium]
MPEPVFVALLIADRVITEDNQKKAIIGTFTQFTVRQLPAALPPWFIFAAVTNLAGEHAFSLNLLFDRSQQVIFSAGGKVSVDDPRRVVELVIQVPNVVFPEEGTYNISFHIDGDLIATRILDVVKTTEQRPVTPGHPG